MTWAKSWGIEEWVFEDLAYRYDEEADNDPTTDDESIQLTLIRKVKNVN